MALPESPFLSWPSRSSRPQLTSATLIPPQVKLAPARFIQGDNLEVLSCLASDPDVQGQVSLAYLDPPFLTGREHFSSKNKDVAPTSLLRAKSRVAAFDDRFPSLSAYLDVLEPRLRATRALLAPHGSMVLHVDPKTSHYAKVICDEIFGHEAFMSEVIWRYRRWPSKTKNFQRVHDVMLRYVRDPKSEPRWTQLYEPLAASTQAAWGTARQRAVVSEQGQRVRSSKTTEPSPGTPLGDVWEMSIVAPVARERTGYPTQKPEALLARWIEALTAPGDLVLDPYVGSGTTLVAAVARGRRAIGIDQGLQARDVVRERLLRAGVEFVEQQAQGAARASIPGVRRARAVAFAQSALDEMLPQTAATPSLSKKASSG